MSVAKHFPFFIFQILSIYCILKAIKYCIVTGILPNWMSKKFVRPGWVRVAQLVINSGYSSVTNNQNIESRISQNHLSCISVTNPIPEISLAKLGQPRLAIAKSDIGRTAVHQEKSVLQLITQLFRNSYREKR